MALATIALLEQPLVWQDWGDCFIAYQVSSTETHIFNATTAEILRCLAESPASMDELRHRVADQLDVGESELLVEDMEFAVNRLDELGLIERSD